MKHTIYNLRTQGLSFGKIASELGISKSTAFRLYKEYCLENNLPVSGVDNPPKKTKFVNEDPPEILPLAETNETVPEADIVVPVFKVISANDLIKKEFSCLEFTGKFLNLIGKPSRVFAAIIWGKPKGGKSNLSVRFADYLSEYFGTVLYIAAEEGHSQSLREKFVVINGGDVNILECRDREGIRIFLKTNPFDFVFIDSINVAKIEDDFLELLKQENPKTSFIAIVQATKGGNFKGTQALTHNCDFIIMVDEGVAYHQGRFGPASEEAIFEGEWYAKNPHKEANGIASEKSKEQKKEDIITEDKDLPKEPVRQRKDMFDITLEDLGIFGPIDKKIW